MEASELLTSIKSKGPAFFNLIAQQMLEDGL
jgi:hypothetical protein